MKEFPQFMKNQLNKVPLSEQNTEDVEGYYYEAANGSQMAFWTAYSDKVSKEHIHEFDEYLVCISGQYIAYIEDEQYILNQGDELYIPKGKNMGANA